MAYGNYIASVPVTEIAELRRDPQVMLHPTRVEIVSHLLGYWIKAQPLGRLLGEALDGGQPLTDDWEHPLRAPVVHPPDEVRRLLAVIREGMETAVAAGASQEIAPFDGDLRSLVNVFQHAADRGEAVVSVLEPPMDEERAAKVRIPFDAGLG